MRWRNQAVLSRRRSRRSSLLSSRSRTFSDGGAYDAGTNTLTWPDTTALSKVSYTFNDPYRAHAMNTTAGGFAFSGTVTQPFTDGGTGALRGDANGDNQVNVKDALAILMHVTGKKLLTGQALANADANQDGKVNVQDALAILYYVTHGNVWKS